MGKVLLQYNPRAVCKEFCQSPEEEAVVLRELFEGPEWVLMDKGEMTPEESLEQIKQRVPEKFHKALHYSSSEDEYMLVEKKNK